MVEPVDPFQGGTFHGFEVAPWPASVDAAPAIFGLIRACKPVCRLPIDDRAGQAEPQVTPQPVPVRPLDQEDRPGRGHEEGLICRRKSEPVAQISAAQRLGGAEIKHGRAKNPQPPLTTPAPPLTRPPLVPQPPLTRPTRSATTAALRVKIRDADSRMVKNKAVYVALGVTRDGLREVLGLWVAQNEGAKFWLSVMNERRNRGVQDVLIAVVGSSGTGSRASPRRSRRPFRWPWSRPVSCTSCAIR